MQVSITFRHMDATEALKNHINDKLEHLKKYLIKPIEVHATLSVEKFRHSAEFILTEQNFRATAIETTDDMYASIDKAISKLETQVKKHKNKVKEHHKRHEGVGEVAMQAEEEYLRSK